MRILLAEDDMKLGKLIQYMLQQKGHFVDWVTSGDMAYEYAMFDPYDIIILDWMMPVESGIDACKRLRENGCESSILMLTARDSIEDRVVGLDGGADDYLVKPFEFEELFARIRALARRTNLKIQKETIVFGEFTLDRTQKLVKRWDSVIQLSPREFQILDLLVQNKGIVISRDRIIERVWGIEGEVNSNIIESYIKLLRRKMGLDEAGTMIKTIRGIGYKLEE
ncbi:response regulator transcription factor [Anaerosinus gibii]|uniref:Response regulator transcription factor n=1 Tax=Selenobaculum gibii TaxID=3054208 RepID=A0A9Y2AGX6_9FIRM|nr:response regulator transcription factor [Selenobaculum gbiensis]WIW69927.1 response regulator transcription factor [Selenobaculum gbiensis]